MWEPRRLTTLWASTTCYRKSFIYYNDRFENSHRPVNGIRVQIWIIRFHKYLTDDASVKLTRRYVKLQNLKGKANFILSKTVFAYSWRRILCCVLQMASIWTVSHMPWLRHLQGQHAASSAFATSTQHTWCAIKQSAIFWHPTLAVRNVRLLRDH
jgi:hypothetical protein